MAPVQQALMAQASDAEKLASLDAAIARLKADFGSWQVPWGEINRFQRLDGAIVRTFDDAKPSIPVPFVSAQLGIARLVRRTALSGDPALLRRLRQQLRRGGRIRSPRPRSRGERRRSEQRPRLAALQRSSEALCAREFASRVFLSRGSRPESQLTQGCARQFLTGLLLRAGKCGSSSLH